MTTDTVGGVWHYALDLCGALASHGVEVLLATMGAPLSASQRSAVGELSNITVFESAFKLEWMQDPWEDVDEAGDWLRSLEAQWQPDLIHLNNFAHGDLPWRAPVLMVAHSCVYSWWRAVHGECPPPEYDEYQRRVERGLQAADLVIAPTEAMGAALHEQYHGVAKSAVIPNGRAVSDFAPLPKRPYIFTAGRLWDEAKNIAMLTSAADELHWPVYVAGDACSPEQNGSRFAAARSERVHLLGQLDRAQMRRWTGAAGVYCLPARYEPFGLSVLEAALCGCALVLGDIPSLRENWEGAARFVDPDDAAGLRAALNALAADVALRTQLGKRARQHAIRFTTKRMGDGYLIAYHALSAARESMLSASAAPLFAPAKGVPQHAMQLQ